MSEREISEGVRAACHEALDRTLDAYEMGTPFQILNAVEYVSNEVAFKLRIFIEEPTP